MRDIKIDSLWGLSTEQFVYLGYDIILDSDGRKCKLGEATCRKRLACPTSPSTNNLRFHGDKHVCCPVGSGTWMLNFFVVIGDIVIPVGEKHGIQLMGIYGAIFNKAYGSNGDLIFAACDHVLAK